MVSVCVYPECAVGVCFVIGTYRADDLLCYASCPEVELGSYFVSGHFLSCSEVELGIPELNSGPVFLFV